MSAPKIRPYPISVPASELDALKQRIASARWPEKETVNDWSQGVPLNLMQELCHYWTDKYDWRAAENWINKSGSSMVEIDGYDIHFLHIRSQHHDALPLLLLHGWPGSILEFRKAADLLTSPEAHGGSAKDAFHLIIPSMPGYGYSSKPKAAGTSVARMAKLYVRLMEILGYTSWIAQGGDFGADLCAALAAKKNNPPTSLLAIHVNVLCFDTVKEFQASASPTEDEKGALAKYYAFQNDEMGYFKLQATKPQTLGYSLADSPIGQAAWIYEKLYSWSDNDGDLEKIFTKDEILDTIMMYWLSNTGTSSAQLYWEEKVDSMAFEIDIPVGITQFPGDNFYVPKSWAERYYSNIIHWQQSKAGGHFAAWEKPEIFVREVRETFRKFQK